MSPESPPPESRSPESGHHEPRPDTATPRGRESGSGGPEPVTPVTGERDEATDHDEEAASPGDTAEAEPPDDPRGAPDPGGAGPRRVRDPRGQEGGAPVPAAPMTSLPRPPRRTGVFIDPDDLREHVGGLLRTVLGGYEVDAFGSFTFLHEGARVFVTVGPSPAGPTVGVFSVTNLDLDLTPELAAFLLTTNHTLAFGAFSYDQANRAVWLRSTLLGATLDLPELRATAAAIATTAAAIDDVVQERFGGRTFLSAPDEVQKRVEPPPTSRDAVPPNVTGYL